MGQILLVFVLLSAPAFACPELQGIYKCKSDGNSNLNVEIKQEVREGTTNYQVEKGSNKELEIYRADGRPDIISFIEPNTGVKIEISTTANCEGTESLVVFRTYTFDGEILGSLNTNIRKEDNRLRITNVFKSIKNELKEEISCL